VSDLLLDPWDAAAQGQSAIIDPWEKEMRSQASSVLPTAELPSAPKPSDHAPIPLVASDLIAKPSSVTHVASSSSTPSAPSSGQKESYAAYWIVGGGLLALGFLAWKYLLPQEEASDGPIEGLDDLVNYALPVSESAYMVVEEVKRNKTKSRVRFPESGAEVWIDAEDLLFESDAKKKGLKERD